MVAKILIFFRNLSLLSIKWNNACKSSEEFLRRDCIWAGMHEECTHIYVYMCAHTSFLAQCLIDSGFQGSSPCPQPCLDTCSVLLAVWFLSIALLLGLLIYFCSETMSCCVLLCSPGCPQTLHPLASVSQELRLQACTPDLVRIIEYKSEHSVAREMT